MDSFDEAAYRDRLINAGLEPAAATSTAAKTAAVHRARHQPAPDSLMANGMIPAQATVAAQERKGRTAAVNPLADLAPDLFDEFERTQEEVEQAIAPVAPPADDPTPKKKALLLKPLEGGLSARHQQLIEDSIAIEQEDARKANAIGYMARTLAQATLPHADPKTPLGQLYSRDTGRLTLTIAPTSRNHGIPYGTIPRVVLAWICTEAVQTQERVLSLGRSQAEFLAKIGMHNNGHDIARFRDQALRLFKAVISVEYVNLHEGEDDSARLMISERARVFWHPKRADQPALWDSTLELSKSFADEILAAPVPIDMRVFHALTKSPMAMDIYVWITYRMFLLQRSGRPFVHIPWISLKMQFGAGYSDTLQGLADFKINFKKRLREVLTFYPEARSCIEDDKKKQSLKLLPAKLHIPYQKRPSNFSLKG